MKIFMRNIKKSFCILCIVAAAALAGCGESSASPEAEAGTSRPENTEYTTLGRLTVHNTDSRLTLLDAKDALSADGLYYASWTAGNAEEYVNSDGETVDLYDAQLYLLSGESKTAEAAETTTKNWLSAGQTNYDVTDEKTIDCGGQTYTLLSYRFTNEDNPYSHGVSAFGVFENCSLCAELTCQEEYGEDLEEMLTTFLAGCRYE